MWRQLHYERRWGFSTQRLGGYLLDEAKGFCVLTLLLSGFGLAAWAVVRATPLWWLDAWAIFAGLTIVIGLLYPMVIAPLFNSYQSLPPGELRDALLGVAHLVEADIAEILVEDSSKRTTKGNAYVSGLGKTRRVVLYDTMVDKPSAELRTVVAHEIGHWKLRHLAKNVPASILLSLLTFAVLGVVLPARPVLRFGHIHQLGDPVGFLLFLLAFPAVTKLTSLAQSWMSRSFEREADLFSLVSTRDADSFQGAMRSIYTTNLNDLAPSRWKRLNASHPPVAERLAMGAAWRASYDARERRASYGATGPSEGSQPHQRSFRAGSP
jgi:STE24 endopeptidase